MPRARRWGPEERGEEDGDRGGAGWWKAFQKAIHTSPFKLGKINLLMRTYITSLVTSNFQFKGNKHLSPSWAYTVVLNFYQHFHLNLFTWGVLYNTDCWASLIQQVWEWLVQVCIFNRCPSGASAVDPGTTLCEPLVYMPDRDWLALPLSELPWCKNIH